MFEVTVICPQCHTILQAWTHDPDAIAQERDENGHYVAPCSACEPPVFTHMTLHQIVQHTSPVDNLARRYPELFDDLNEAELAKLHAFCEVR